MLPLRLAPAAALLASAIWSVAPLQAGQDSEEAEATVARPNVVFILADDLGYGDLRSYNEASRIPTPRLDRLAAGVVRDRRTDLLFLGVEEQKAPIARRCVSEQLVRRNLDLAIGPLCRDDGVRGTEVDADVSRRHGARPYTSRRP